MIIKLFIIIFLVNLVYSFKTKLSLKESLVFISLNKVRLIILSVIILNLEFNLQILIFSIAFLVWEAIFSVTFNHEMRVLLGFTFSICTFSFLPLLLLGGEKALILEFCISDEIFKQIQKNLLKFQQKHPKKFSILAGLGLATALVYSGINLYDNYIDIVHINDINKLLELNNQQKSILMDQFQLYKDCPEDFRHYEEIPKDLDELLKNEQILIEKRANLKLKQWKK